MISLLLPNIVAIDKSNFDKQKMLLESVTLN